MRFVAGCAVFLVAVSAFAHHGKDFLIVESNELPHPATAFFVTSEQFVFGDGHVTFRDEPSLLLGIAERAAVEVHAHIAKVPHESATIEAIAPAIHVRLFDAGTIHAGASGEYEIGRHGEGNSATVRFIVGRSVGEGALVGNIGVVRPHGEGASAIYAFGYRPDMEASRSWGVEAQGTLRHGAEHEFLGAIYGQPNERLTVKAGVGAVLGSGKASAVVRTGIVWRF